MGPERDSERRPANIRESDRHVETPCDQRHSERKPTNMGDSERHVATPWDQR